MFNMAKLINNHLHAVFVSHITEQEAFFQLFCGPDKASTYNKATSLCENLVPR